MDWVSLPLALVLAGRSATPERLGVSGGAWVSHQRLLAAQAPTQAPRSTPLPPLPLTQLDDRVLAADFDNRTFTLTFAQPVALSEVLLLLVRGTSLSVVPDPSVNGSFIGELKNVTVRQALTLILPPFGLDFAVDGGFIRVFRRQPETRLFDINYLAAERAGEVRVGGGPADGASGSYARVSTTVKTDVFADTAKGIQTLLSSGGTFNVDRKAGLVQVTDFPERLDRVALYLDAVQDRVQRQVQIDAVVAEVELNDERAVPLNGSALGTSRNADRMLAALAAVGKLTVLTNPRLIVTNNEPAIVTGPGLTISVTPQISSDSIVTLGLSPIVGSPQELKSDMVARVASGDTVVVTGAGRQRETRERKTGVTRKRVELVVLLTPRVLPLP